MPKYWYAGAFQVMPPSFVIAWRLCVVLGAFYYMNNNYFLYLISILNHANTFGRMLIVTQGIFARE